MTRAEYEAKYGSSPKPQPVQMTRAQYEAKYGAAAPTQTAKSSLFSRIATGVKQAATDRSKTVSEAKSRVQQGKQTKAEGVLQAAGQTAGLITDTAFVAGKEAVRSVAPSAIPLAKKTLGAVLQTKPIQAIAEKYGQVKEAHPRATANLEALTNIAGIVPTAKAGQIAAKGAGKTAKVATEIADQGTRTVGKAMKNAPASAASVLTNVPKDVFERAANPEWTPMIERAIKHVSENEKQPYLEVANRASHAIAGAERRAADRLAIEKNLFKGDNKGARFDVASRYEDIAVALKPFRSSGLVVDTKDGPRGKVLDFKVGMTPQSSFTSREVDELNQLLSKIKASDAVEIDDLLSLRQAFSTAYDAVPLGVNKNPRPYHAAVMALKYSAEQTIDDILPPGLKEAFSEYRMVEEMKEAIGNKVIDGKGELKDSAEQFLANLSNINKGGVRSSADELKAMTGIDIVREVQAIKDAQKLSENFARTGSRSQDILRSVLAAGMGSMTGGLPGLAAGVAVTSPKVLGKAALKVGNMRASKKAKKVGEYLKNVQPGLSTKDVTRDKLDQVRDFLIDQLPKSSGKLNLDIEQEAADFLEYLKDTSSITAQDVNRAMEILQLQGKTSVINSLRTQLGAEARTFNRDKGGRFARTVKAALSR